MLLHKMVPSLVIQPMRVFLYPGSLYGIFIVQALKRLITFELWEEILLDLEPGGHARYSGNEGNNCSESRWYHEYKARPWIATTVVIRGRVF